VCARALDTLRACDRILAEDTRRTRQLLAHFGIPAKRVDRLDAHAREHELTKVVARLCAGERVALVTDAGTPGVSDPGEALVEAAIRHAVPVVPVPGPSAVITALVASGLAPGGRFRFVGFLPRGGGARRAAIDLVCETPEAVVLFESPHRTSATLSDLARQTPDRRACVARELTKAHEEFVRGTLIELANPVEPRVWRGEITIVLSAYQRASAVSSEAAVANESALDEQIDGALATGRSVRAIAETLSIETGLPKRALYARIVTRKNAATATRR
jgi:16S rRNA (cytidine1402-2'-O)-methyltransferase